MIWGKTDLPVTSWPNISIKGFVMWYVSSVKKKKETETGSAKVNLMLLLFSLKKSSLNIYTEVGLSNMYKWLIILIL